MIKTAIHHQPEEDWDWLRGESERFLRLGLQTPRVPPELQYRQLEQVLHAEQYDEPVQRPACNEGAATKITIVTMLMMRVRPGVVFICVR
jgi:hypothetical protein